ncbi:hypothetical protein LIER_25836 [Lithospermum erythrorhizon]|uniref:RING-type domain-containing protein n=1 Tax=Lithospermum erythrorhizon TaxID=34254 RepID=A0AAV3R698_LITER
MMFPTYNAAMNDSIPAKYVTMKEDSGLTYAHHLPVLSRKRSREDSNNSITMNQQFVPFVAENLNNCCNFNNNYSSGSFSFLGEDFSSQIQQDQLEVDRLIAHHMEKVRERGRRIMMAVVDDSIAKKLKSKEEQLEKIGKQNSGLVDRVKSLYVENQIWRDLAETNEATATALRNKLEQVLAQVQADDREINGVVGELVDDARSCCGSNCNGDVQMRMLAGDSIRGVESNRGATNGKMCRSCGMEEACVLLLPCRHLCLCSGCGSFLHICPVCKSTKSCSLHVNLSTY